jgi:hypothetical protein
MLSVKRSSSSRAQAEIPASWKGYLKSSTDLDAIITTELHKAKYHEFANELKQTGNWDKVRVCVAVIFECSKRPAAGRFFRLVREQLLTQEEQNQLGQLEGREAKLKKVFDFAEKWDSQEIKTFLEILNNDEIAGGALREILSPTALASLGASGGMQSSLAQSSRAQSSRAVESSQNVKPQEFKSWFRNIYKASEPSDMFAAMGDGVQDILLEMERKGLITEGERWRIKDEGGDDDRNLGITKVMWDKVERQFSPEKRNCFAEIIYGSNEGNMKHFFREKNPHFPFYYARPTGTAAESSKSPEKSFVVWYDEFFKFKHRMTVISKLSSKIEGILYQMYSQHLIPQDKRMEIKGRSEIGSGRTNGWKMAELVWEVVERDLTSVKRNKFAKIVWAAYGSDRESLLNETAIDNAKYR